MGVAVIDASALVAYYSIDDPRRRAVIRRLSVSGAYFAAAHLDVEVLSGIRLVARNDARMRAAVPTALRHLDGMPIRRMAIAPLLQRTWQLRHNVTPYDAAYVALAEGLSCPLVTCDAKLAGASGMRCEVELIG
ncbi:MAG: type II toxin-antitoxin system VapC family toxin [Actinomycetia bacterium]|nr:type II toxin-antitoxin system VapC family toxin [Actinomycetes bacterium]